MPGPIPHDMEAWVSRINRDLQALKRRPGQGGPRQVSLPAPPTEGEWAAGQVAWNSAPTAGGPAGWVCVTGGEPGVWKVFAVVSM